MAFNQKRHAERNVCSSFMFKLFLYYVFLSYIKYIIISCWNNFLSCRTEKDYYVILWYIYAEANWRSCWKLIVMLEVTNDINFSCDVIRSSRVCHMNQIISSANNWIICTYKWGPGFIRNAIMSISFASTLQRCTHGQTLGSQVCFCSE